jgi:3-mercaptopyruvate sulfurtransferase SseA
MSRCDRHELRTAAATAPDPATAAPGRRPYPEEIAMPTAVTRDEVRELVAAGVQLVEVLPGAEYRWAHLPGAVNLPLKELDARTDQLDRSRPVIVYCHDTV